MTQPPQPIDVAPMAFTVARRLGTVDQPAQVDARRLARVGVAAPSARRAGSQRPASTTIRGLVVLMLITVMLTYGCAVDPPQQQPGPIGSVPGDPTAQPTGGTTAAATAGTDKLLVIIEENKSVADVEQHMPVLAAESARYGHADQYYALTHPSLPNYLVIAGGSLFGVTDDEGPEVHQLTGPSVFGQLHAAGHTVKTYAEAMDSNCTTHNQDRYAVRHNPWTYFTDNTERSLCKQFDVPAGTTTTGPLVDDVTRGRLPTFSLVIPDICNDGHDCSAATADRWLSRWLPILTNGPDFRSGHLTILVTWDEDDRTSGNRIACVVMNPALNGRTVATRLDHYALSAAISDLGHQSPLRDAKASPDLLTAFGLQ